MKNWFKYIIPTIIIIALIIALDLAVDFIVINSNLSDWWKFILLK